MALLVVKVIRAFLDLLERLVEMVLLDLLELLVRVAQKVTQPTLLIKMPLSLEVSTSFQQVRLL